jgi:hypothetical protein
MKTDILIFGAGSFGKHAYLYYSSIYNIAGFIDNNPNPIEKNIFGIPIFSPNILKNEIYRDIPIVIANYAHYKDIQKQLYDDYGISDTILFHIKTAERFLRFSDNLEENVNRIQDFILEYKGGLGNQMFQYVFHRWLEKRGFNVEADLSGYHLLRGRSFCLNKIFERVDIKECNYLRLERLKEAKEVYDEEEDTLFDLEKNQGSILCGYWQHFAYADEIKDEIKERYIFSLPLEKELIHTMDRLRKENSVAVHVRGGDYLEKENMCLFGNICTHEYYYNAVKYINENVLNPKFYVFCNDISWTKEYMKMKDAVYIDRNRFDNYEDWYDLFLMTQCKHNIIANSSFSWWGAWLNQNSNKIVIAPQKWRNDLSLKNICPQEWIRI